MNLKRHHCKNHPAKLTTRRCYHCHEYICSDCQITLDHHIFCGHFCHLRWKWQQVSQKINVSKELVTVTIILVLINIIIFIYFNSKLEAIQYNLYTQVEIKPDTTRPKLPTHTIQFDTTRYPLKNVFQFHLSITDGAVAALKRDGRFVESKVQNDHPLVFHNQFLNQGENKFSIYLLKNGGTSSLVDSFTITFKSARVEYMRKYITHIEGDSSGIALTFDGGSSSNGTERILNILREQNVRCTIFLTGDFLQKYPKLVKQMINDGHEIGNHSYSHPHLTMLEKDGSINTLDNVNRKLVHRQLLKTDSIFRDITGVPMSPVWRAPYGEINNEILLWAAEAGFKHIGWSDKCDTWDWVKDTTSSIYRTAPEILEHFLKLDKEIGLGGKIILMHLGTEREKEMPYEILADMITQLRERGYHFKTVGQLLTSS